MRSKTARVLFSALLVATLGVAPAPTVGAIPPVDPSSGPAGGGARVSGLIPPVFTTVAAADDAGYGLDENGKVWAWGHNNYGQLGNGTLTDSVWPVQMQAETGALPVLTAIAAGAHTGYALDKDGGLWTWGYNYYGQLGDGTNTDSSWPRRVTQAVSGELPAFTAIAVGAFSGYALDENGGLWTWGYNSYGQLGNNTATPSSMPSRVTQAVSGELPPLTAIAAGAQTGYALADDGGIWAWGYNGLGQLGNDSNVTSARQPVRIWTFQGGTPPVFTAIAAGHYTGYGLDQDGRVWAWGWNNNGQLGNGTTTNSTRRPGQVQPTSGTLPKFTAITAGDYTGYALDETGSIWAWGGNGSGQLGDGTNRNSSTPVQVRLAFGELPVLTQVAAGGGTAYALDKDGGIWAWGANLYGQLGNGETRDASTPVPLVAAVTNVMFGTRQGTNLNTNGSTWSIT
ncbi:MAG: hypothetical protein FWD59_01580, partial [Micrococcales bacterium]|nr:hypothetical protein [Micrococcales bacterium]